MTISKETLSLINAFKNPLLEILTDIKDEVKFYFDTGIIKYIESIRKKFIKTKTFLYRLENVNFYDIYFPITIENKSTKDYLIDNIEELFNKSNFISIIGNAGCGKSMLLKHVFLNSIMQIVKIPIVIELRNLNDFDGSFMDYLNNLLSGKKLAPNKKILERILSNGEFLFLLDGYDEIFSDNKNKLTSELIEFIDNYSSNYFFITSRPGANVESLPRFDSYSVNDLNDKQVKDFINLQLKNCGDKELANKIINVISKPENQDYNSYLSSPLLLSMFIMTFNSYPEIPKSKSKFYWNVYDTLCTKHDSFTKHGGYQHERKTGLQNEDFENILKWFSFISLFKGKYSFDEQYFTQLLKKIKNKLQLKCSIENLKEDLTVAISILMIDDLEYKFPHKSLQEYFSALLITGQNEKIKKEIYTKKFDKVSGHSFGDNGNMWILLNELDTVPFNRYYITRHIENFYKRINLELHDAKIKSFIQSGGHEIYASYDKQDNNGSLNLATSSTIETSALAFTGIYLMKLNYDIHGVIWKKLKTIQDINQALPALESGSDKHYSFIDLDEKTQNEIIFKIKKEKLDNKISQGVQSVKNKLVEVKKEIKEYEKRKNDLLNL
ncbi:MAG: NACHT domain-containing protein [Bacteroidetes bacterium]|jgi:ABC-type cobalamin/Fe3+-siderophores transport system ATPase subunit|nr:NACHT domain-containing protein [Bacteroidota bacterium]MBT7145260.1 NACHT domain-containing protein [Bacteroidota bacterium]